MSLNQDACPLEANVRASRCESCCAANNNVPPCVQAYLGGRKAMSSNVVNIRHIGFADRKAA